MSTIPRTWQQTVPWGDVIRAAMSYVDRADAAPINDIQNRVKVECGRDEATRLMNQTFLPLVAKTREDRKRSAQEKITQDIDRAPWDLFSSAKITNIINQALSGNFGPWEAASRKVLDAGGTTTGQGKLTAYISQKSESVRDKANAAKTKEIRDRETVETVNQAETDRRTTDLQKQFTAWYHVSLPVLAAERNRAEFDKELTAWVQMGLGAADRQRAVDRWDNIVAGAQEATPDDPIDPAPDPPEIRDGRSGAVWYPGLSNVSTVDEVLQAAEALLRKDNTVWQRYYTKVYVAQGQKLAMRFTAAVLTEARRIQGSGPGIKTDENNWALLAAGAVALLTLGR